MPRFDGEVFLLGTAISAPVPFQKSFVSTALANNTGTGNESQKRRVDTCEAADERRLIPNFPCFASLCEAVSKRANNREDIMLSLPITLTIAAGAALVNIWLMIRCGQARTKGKVSIGDGGDEHLIRRMRAHANFVESAPFVLILIAALEASGFAGQWLYYIGVLYIVGRLAHGLGMDGGALEKGRMVGTLITLLTLLGLAGYALWRVYTGG
jgi:uncharacterized protein